jgi:hypothetical protein
MRVTYGYSTRQASVVSPRDHEADWELPLCSVDRGSQAQHLSRGRSKSKLPRVLSDQHMSFSHHCKGGNRKGTWQVRDCLQQLHFGKSPHLSSPGLPQSKIQMKTSPCQGWLLRSRWCHVEPQPLQHSRLWEEVAEVLQVNQVAMSPPNPKSSPHSPPACPAAAINSTDSAGDQHRWV